MNRFFWGMMAGAVIAFFLTISNCRADSTDRYGQPPNYGNTTYYNGPNGEPRGSASTYGNTTYYYNQYGQNIGSATTVPQAKGNQPTWNPNIQPARK